MDRLGQMLPALLPTGSTKTADTGLCSRKAAAEYAGRLLSLFQHQGGADSAALVPGIATIFVRYPEAVVRTVCDPFEGLPGKQKWEPSIYEVRQACEAEMAPVYRQRDRERRFAQTTNLLAAPVEKRLSREEIAEVVRRTFASPDGQEAKSPEQVRAEAEARVRELYQESRTPKPLTIGPELARKLDGYAAEMAAFSERRRTLGEEFVREDAPRALADEG